MCWVDRADPRGSAINHPPLGRNCLIQGNVATSYVAIFSSRQTVDAIGWLPRRNQSLVNGYNICSVHRTDSKGP